MSKINGRVARYYYYWVDNTASQYPCIMHVFGKEDWLSPGPTLEEYHANLVDYYTRNNMMDERRDLQVFSSLNAMYQHIKRVVPKELKLWGYVRDEVAQKGFAAAFQEVRPQEATDE